jgi:HEAT repeat protein
LQRIKSRRLLIDALSIVGRFDVKRLGEALNDKWYVARNIVIVLGKIGDSWSIEFLSKALSHNDQRVRKEAIKAIASIGGTDIIPHLRTAINDADPSIRITAARTLGNLKTESAKKVLLEEVSRKDFLDREFSEKKEFYDAITHWYDKEVKDFLFKTLKKKRLWKKTKNDETRACAAYALGIMGDREAIPLLEKTKNSKNKLLKSLSTAAINQLTG